MWKVFRYPFLIEGTDLESRKRIRAYLASHGYRIAEATIDLFDWAYNDVYTRCVAHDDVGSIRAIETRYVQAAIEELRRSDAVAQRLFGRRIRQVLLLHIGAFQARMIDKLLSEYERAGVRFVTLD